MARKVYAYNDIKGYTRKFSKSVNDQANLSFPEREFLPQKIVNDQREFQSENLSSRAKALLCGKSFVLLA